VGFRWFVQLEAERLKLSGWVTNRDDGDVEGEVEGDTVAVEEMLKLLRRGPHSAQVSALKIEPRAALKIKTPFEIR
jgi:acylphosphatase